MLQPISAPDVHPSQKQAPLLPKLRGQSVEFLNEGYPARLRILSPSTCVGLRYGHLKNSPRGFSRQCGVDQFQPYGYPFASRSWVLNPGRGICLPSPPTGLDQDDQRLTWSTLLQAPWVKTLFRWYGNINPFSICYAFRPHLRCRLTLGGRAFPRKP